MYYKNCSIYNSLSFCSTFGTCSLRIGSYAITVNELAGICVRPSSITYDL